MSSSNLSSDENDTSQYEGLKYNDAEVFIDILERYYIPILLVVGSIGNCLSIFVLLSTKMRRNSSSWYLAALAVSDTGVLVTVFVPWLLYFNISIADQQYFCQICNYLAYVCSFLSAWYVFS
ncbi:hypothetical protein QAD02_006841 [Eretmocerus hayati]|uniref:Uncharacterized protein n=1 Tax=Eretmocerus hayati TaxID=131215 RepID=A0ACC2N4E9_9HYME|nr:hypothetical protein QAD02_006841 [Eretmocerus hayati]